MPNNPATYLIVQMQGTYAVFPPDADVAHVGGALQVSQGGKVYTFGTPVVPYSDPMLFFNQKLVAGGMINLGAGTQQGHLHVPVEVTPITFVGQGMRKTILDGQGGIGAGHRLSFGKGIIHVAGTVTLQGLGFINGGGADGVSDGECGVYAEGASGVLTVVLCAFDGCEDGVFAPPGNLMTYILDRCVFGRTAANGLADGRSHDTYVGAENFVIKGSVFCGTSNGNTIKSRSPKVDVTDSFVARSNGRWIDLPGATDLTTSRNTFVTLAGASSGNAFGINDEGDGNVQPGKSGSWLSTDDTFIFSRTTETLWFPDANTRVEFVRPVVQWAGPKGSAPPSIEVRAPAGFTFVGGVNPFVLTEANRLDAFPAIPADPV